MIFNFEFLVVLRIVDKVSVGVVIFVLISFDDGNLEVIVLMNVFVFFGFLFIF